MGEPAHRRRLEVPVGALSVTLQGITFVGSSADDPEILQALPGDLRHLLQEVNGLVAYEGGLHFRGACQQPEWHSIRRVWRGPQALCEWYPSLHHDDVPFAEDSVGDQWFIRGGTVWRLAAETGDTEDLGQDLSAFLSAVERDPVATLGLQPLMRFRAEGGALSPGQLLNVYPPFCTVEASRGVDIAAVPTLERLYFLAELARQLPPEGKFRVTVT